MKVPYVCCTKKFEEHYTNHTGSGIPVYEGVSFQKGYGLGGVFRRWIRAALPFLVKGGKAVGKEVLTTGANIINDVVSGEDIKIATKRRSKEVGKNIVQKALNQVQSLIGRGKYKRKQKSQRRIIPSKVRKRKGRDISDS